MLLTLLHHADRDIKAMVYVDDNVRHVGNVFSAAVDRNLEVSSFQYQHEDVRVQRFQYGDKGDVTRRWHRLRDTLQAVFDEPARSCRYILALAMARAYAARVRVPARSRW